jgi:hypothetical protein
MTICLETSGKCLKRVIALVTLQMAVSSFGSRSYALQGPKIVPSSRMVVKAPYLAEMPAFMSW